MMDVARRESGTRIRKRDVVFLTAKLGDSRETTKSEYHSSSNIIAIYKRLKTEICRNLTNSHNPKKNTGAFSPESRESIKTNELQRDSAQRFTMALRAVFFSSLRCTRCTRIPWTKVQTYSHLARRFPPNAPHHEITDRLKLKRTRGKTKQRPTFARFFPAKSRNAPAFALRA